MMPLLDDEKPEPTIAFQSEHHGTLVLSLHFTMARYGVFYERLTDHLKADAAATVDVLAASCAKEVSGRQFIPSQESDKRALSRLNLTLTTAEREKFATSFLAEQSWLLETTETEDVLPKSPDDIPTSVIRFVPRTDVQWADDPVGRLGQALMLRHEEERKRWRRILGPMHDFQARFNAFRGDWFPATSLASRISEISETSRLALSALSPLLDGHLLKSALPDSSGHSIKAIANYGAGLEHLNPAMGVSQHLTGLRLPHYPTLELPEVGRLRDDWARWDKLAEVSDSILKLSGPRFAYETGAASVLASLAKTSWIDDVTLSSRLLRPTHEFTSYIESSAAIAARLPPGLLGTLDQITRFGTDHFGACTSLAGEFLEQAAESDADAADDDNPALDLLPAHRDQILRRAEEADQFPNGDALALSPLTPIARSTIAVLRLLLYCNEAARIRGREPVFKTTDMTMAAALDLPFLAPDDHAKMGSALSHLYAAIYESAGGASLRFMSDKEKSRKSYFDKTDPAVAAIFHLKTLRTAWAHDINHGSERDIEKKWLTRGDALRSLGMSDMPKSGTDHLTLYRVLLARLESFLSELLDRIRSSSGIK